jgi:hypothetical protein
VCGVSSCLFLVEGVVVSETLFGFGFVVLETPFGLFLVGGVVASETLFGLSCVVSETPFGLLGGVV